MKDESSRKKTAARGPKRLARGFVQTGGILQQRIRTAGEKRGFAQTRLLTHWAELVGEEIAAISRPVRIGYARQGFGATLTLLTSGANAPVLQAQLPRIRERVNACYGYQAVSHIRLTQTSASGFEEARAEFTPRGETDRKPGSDPALAAAAARKVADVTSDELRAALAALGANVLSRGKNRKTRQT